MDLSQYNVRGSGLSISINPITFNNIILKVEEASASSKSVFVVALLILHGSYKACPATLAVSLDAWSNVFALLTPILENSFTLSLAV